MKNEIQDSHNTLLKNHSLIFFTATAVLLLTSPDAFAVSTEALREPLTTFKTEVFDWARPLQILAGVSGCVMFFFRQSIVPIAYGFGVAVALQFFKAYAEGTTALIG